MTNAMDNIEKYQKQLLEQTQNLYRETPISEATKQAYLAIPRHRFVQRYREWGTKEWNVVNTENLAQHIAMLYADRALILFGNDDQNLLSTISQPSLVLRMVDLLELKVGDRVLELGAGSGWSAALMGGIVGAKGHVVSLEIIPELAQNAAENIASMGIANVQILSGDGAQGCNDSAPYDRVVFTAGTFDLPYYFYEQLRDQGLLLVVIKTEGGGDHLFLLRKTEDHFESLWSAPCGFVQLRGSYEFEDLEPNTLDKAIPEWSQLQNSEISKRRFWWGAKGEPTRTWSTVGIRSFLGITEPTFRSLKTVKPEDSTARHYFGLWDAASDSLVIARDDWLITYGNHKAEERLLQRLHHWVEIGMPSAASLDLKVYPIGARLQAGGNQWLIKRRDSQFLWTLQP
jgi:protein-L-isoaspartate(D-aspartate) O-methyltransferase